MVMFVILRIDVEPFVYAKQPKSRSISGTISQKGNCRITSFSFFLHMNEEEEKKNARVI